jgi:hypothetical protein
MPYRFLKLAEDYGQSGTRMDLVQTIPNRGATANNATAEEYVKESNPGLRLGFFHALAPKNDVCGRAEGKQSYPTTFYSTGEMLRKDFFTGSEAVAEIEQAIFTCREPTTSSITGGVITAVIDADENCTVTVANSAGQVLAESEARTDNTSTLSHYGYTGAGVQYLADRSTFDAQNRLDTVQTFAANGSLTTDVDYDQANAGTWGSVTRAYDTAGRLDTVMTVNDNASFSTVDYDQANAGTWVRFHAYASVAFVPQRR